MRPAALSGLKTRVRPLNYPPRWTASPPQEAQQRRDALLAAYPAQAEAAARAYDIARTSPADRCCASSPTQAT